MGLKTDSCIVDGQRFLSHHAVILGLGVSNPRSEGPDGTHELQSGLVWLDSGTANYVVLTYPDAMAAVDAANDSGFQGHSDWRLAELTELTAAADHGSDLLNLCGTPDSPLYRWQVPHANYTFWSSALKGIHQHYSVMRIAASRFLKIEGRDTGGTNFHIVLAMFVRPG